MRRDVRWAIGLGAGLLVGGASFVLAGSPHIAVSTAAVYVLTTGMLLRAADGLQALPDWKDSRTDKFWPLGLALLLSVPGTLIGGSPLAGSMAAHLALLLFVAGIAGGGIAVGILLTLGGLDPEGATQSART